MTRQAVHLIIALGWIGWLASVHPASAQVSAGAKQKSPSTEIAAPARDTRDQYLDDSLRNIPHVQWASTLLGFSSEAGEKMFSAQQVLGKPNKMPATGISAVAWMPDMRSRLPEEWIKVGFEQPMSVHQILIAENFRPGAIEAIYLFDQNNLPETVYRRDSTRVDSGKTLAGSKGRLLQIHLEQAYDNISALMVMLKPMDSIAIHQIDAIGIANNSETITLPIRQLPMPEGAGKPENLGPNINSFFDEVFPVISPDGQTLYFDRKNHPANLGPGNHDDIWVSTLDSSGQWTYAVNAGPPLNNPSHNFACSISPDGNTLLLGNAYQEDGALTSGLSFSHRTVEGWSFPKPVDMLNYYNLDEFGEYQLASNGKVILMAIEREDSKGRRDLYVSFRMQGDRWAAPLHLGPDVNSAGLEMSPFLAPDMRTLYFSSNGFPGYGDNDMFMSRREDESWQSWSEPVNLGPVLNSRNLDAYYTVPASGDYAYYASANKAIGRTDLFRISIPEGLQPDPVVLVRGQVLDAISGAPVPAEIRYSMTDSDSLAGIARSGPEDGRYRVVLPFGEQYHIQAEAAGYFALQEQLDLTRVTEYEERVRDLTLIPLKKGQVVPMKNIFFPVNSDSLLPVSYRELDRVADLLRRYPALRIEIGGHTNDRCSESYCLELSRKRARSVAQYYYQLGFMVERVQWVGYGSAKPIADNLTDEGRNQNQRVEFTIMDFAE